MTDEQRQRIVWSSEWNIRRSMRTIARNDCGDFTVSVRLVDWVALPDLAVTVSVYDPAGVPLVLSPELLPPPPQEEKNVSRKIRDKRSQGRAERWRGFLPSRETHPIIATVHGHVADRKPP